MKKEAGGAAQPRPVTGCEEDGRESPCSYLRVVKSMGGYPSSPRFLEDNKITDVYKT